RRVQGNHGFALARGLEMSSSPCDVAVTRRADSFERPGQGELGVRQRHAGDLKMGRFALRQRRRRAEDQLPSGHGPSSFTATFRYRTGQPSDCKQILPSDGLALRPSLTCSPLRTTMTWPSRAVISYLSQDPSGGRFVTNGPRLAPSTLPPRTPNRLPASPW